MDFLSALAHLKNGIKMRRPKWDKYSFYYYDGGIYLHNSDMKDVLYVNLPLHEIEARDWEEYKEPVRTEKVEAKSIRTGNTIIIAGVPRKVTQVKIHVNIQNEWIQDYNLNDIVERVIQ